jgi:hypothetical protein
LGKNKSTLCFLYGIWLTLTHNPISHLINKTHIEGHSFVPASDSWRDQSGWGELICERCGKKSE